MPDVHFHIPIWLLWSLGGVVGIAVLLLAASGVAWLLAMRNFRLS